MNTEKNAENSLAIVKNKIQTMTAELDEKYASEVIEKDEMAKTLVDEKDITEKDAYLYVRGHDLFDHLVNSVLDPVIAQLRSKHYSCLQNKDGSERRTALMAYQGKGKSVRELLQRNFRFKNQSPLYEKIKQDFSMIW